MGDQQATGVANSGEPPVVTREMLLAELEGADAGEGVEAKSTIDEPDPDADDAEATPIESDAVDSDDDDETNADLDEDDGEDDLTAKDPETAKRVAMVRRQEQRAREAIAAERRSFERERAEHAEDIKALREFQDLRKRFKYDPLGVSAALGATEDDYEELARSFYAHSKKGAADPRNKEAVEQSRKERELRARLDEVQKRLDERDQSEMQAAAQAAAQREAAKYVDGVAKAASVKTPLAAHFLAKSPERTKAALGQIALELATEMDAVPPASLVLRTFEKRRREEMIDMGLDPATIVKSKGKTPEATKNGKAATTVATGSASAKEPTKDDLIAELSQLD